ncbi:MAG: hypothetical protein J7L95_04265 [Prolixibacteraceae bacterium]|nr:hypothetical protein [Prolixibacteraceae bacterium]
MNNILLLNSYSTSLVFDKTTGNLKRIEIRIPAWTFKEGKETIKVRLSGN